MQLKRTLVLTAAFALFLGAQARAAEVAVMPVQGVNLSEGNTDAIGVLFANAFSRDARVAVASPLETRPLLTGGNTAATVAGQLGVTRYVELSALQIGQKIKIGGVLHAQDGAVVFRAETSARSLDELDTAIAMLAHALVWRRPIPRDQVMDESAAGQEASYEVPAVPETPPDPKVPRGAYGPKVGIAIPQSSGKTFSPGIFAEFDGRYGPRDYFLEFGAGLMIPTDNQYNSSTIQVTTGFVELGGSYYLWQGSSALYLGGGVAPAVWSSQVNLDSHTSATCSVFGQVGFNLTRDSRFRIYGEFRFSQLILAVAHPISDGTGYATTISDPYRPMLLTIEGGLGW